MKTLQGVVSKVRFSTEVTGIDNSTSTSQVAVFELDGQYVEIKLPDSIIISNADTVVIAGALKRGLFKARAYKNITTGVSGKNHVFIFYLIGAIFSAVGLATILFGIGLIFLPVGLYLIYNGKQNSKAYKLIENA